MAKKVSSPATTFKSGETTFKVSDQGVSVASGSNQAKLVGWGTIARLAGGKPTTLEPILVRLDTWLAKHRKRYHDGLVKGASSAALAALEKTLGQPLPTELREWLSWHNGQDENVIGAFKEAFNLMSAEQMGQAWRERQKAREPGWNSAWIPLLDDFQEDLIVLDPTSPGCAVREVWRGAADQPITALTLAGWLEEFTGDVESGLYHEDPERGEFMRSS